jgi:hypothetical protein
MKSHYIGTIVGAILGVILIMIWMVTYEPHGGMNLSFYLFPISALILAFAFEGKDVPVVLWYVGAFLQWLSIGIAFDFIAYLIRRK